jgi:hypothetical protein
MIDYLKTLLAIARGRKLKPVAIQLDEATYSEVALELYKANPALIKLGTNVTDLTLEGVPVLVDRNRLTKSLFIEIETND